MRPLMKAGKPVHNYQQGLTPVNRLLLVFPPCRRQRCSLLL
ncbi:hypothetical protein LTSERUB_3302 [Salmonella enterica subsp. enterica serovar Rubislaw str. A4-653]|uniref:Uncharacterized protein n=1 Tax=Salmonella enterica subsp. enterica serovar Rubislaw str. A4-653 TaxID=913081 RepID=G5QKT1_SALRU|nr:hypothetical protein LTSERUB_3302 [Salmonella enterica subsp. enterica serovar Rubislaw str. A4-653]